MEVMFAKILGFSVSFHQYTSPFTYINAILVMEIFCEIRSNKIPSKILLSLSASSFGVYIIHSHVLIYDNLISGRLEWFGDTNPVLWLMYFVIINIGIYLFCHICELVRKLIFKWLHVDSFAKKIGDDLDKKLGWNSEI